MAAYKHEYLKSGDIHLVFIKTDLKSAKSECYAAHNACINDQLNWAFHKGFLRDGQFISIAQRFCLLSMAEDQEELHIYRGKTASYMSMEHKKYRKKKVKNKDSCWSQLDNINCTYIYYIIWLTLPEKIKLNSLDAPQAEHQAQTELQKLQNTMEIMHSTNWEDKHRVKRNASVIYQWFTLIQRYPMHYQIP